jgi:hypothetical protein
MREAYEAAQAKLLDLIDGPDKGLHFSAYRKQLNAALQEQQEAHDAMMAAWDAPRIMLGVPVEQLPEDWSTIAATQVPIMAIHTVCDSEYRKPEVIGYVVVDRGGKLIGQQFENREDAQARADAWTSDCTYGGVDWDYRVAEITEAGE